VINVFQVVLEFKKWLGSATDYSSFKIKILHHLSLE
jgi:hypothetical protein